MNLDSRFSKEKLRRVWSRLILLFALAFPLAAQPLTIEPQSSIGFLTMDAGLEPICFVRDTDKKPWKIEVSQGRSMEDCALSMAKEILKSSERHEADRKRMMDLIERQQDLIERLQQGFPPQVPGTPKRKASWESDPNIFWPKGGPECNLNCPSPTERLSVIRSVSKNPVTPPPALSSSPFLVNLPNRWAGGLFLSQATLAGATGLDVYSSRGLEELNPVLGRGPFGIRQAGITIGATGAIILAETILVRKFPRSRRLFTYFNLGASGVRIGAATHNLRQ